MVILRRMCTDFSPWQTRIQMELQTGHRLHKPVVLFIFMPMSIKRDRVNRVTGLVYLPIDGSRLYKGQEVDLVHVEEQPIDCAVRDSMEMSKPVDSNAIGDAVFDAMLDSRSVPLVLGHRGTQTDTVLGDNSTRRLVGTGRMDYMGESADNYCDAMDERYRIVMLTTESGTKIRTDDGKILRLEIAGRI